MAATIGVALTLPLLTDPPTARAATNPVVEAESRVRTSSRIHDSSASGRAAARVTSVSAPANVGAGTYAVRARVRSAGAPRIDVIVGGDMVGSWSVGATWTTVEAVARVDGPTQLVGVRVQPGAGRAPVDVDWWSLTSSAGAFTVRGPDVLDTAGRTFVARGLNVSMASTRKDAAGRLVLDEPQGRYVDPWGANAVRYTLNQEHWLADCPVSIAGRVSTTYRRAVTADVADMTSRGIAALVKLAHTERGKDTGCSVPTAPVLKEMADTRSVAFWQSVASTFRSNPLVMFDLFNEPRGISDAVWRDGGTVAYTAPTTGSFQAVGMQRLYETVRATGATNLVFAGGRGWASDPSVALRRPLDGYGIVLSSHVYCTGAGCSPSSPALPPTIDQYNSGAVRARHPLVVTEFGWTDPGDRRFNDLFLEWARPRDVGWMSFGFMWTGPLSIVSNWKPTLSIGGALTKPPSAGGMPVWNELAPLRMARGYPAMPM